MNTATGIFEASADARRAMEALSAMGVPARDISVIAPGDPHATAERVPTTEGEQPGMGAALGGVVGGATGAATGLPIGAALTSITVPGIGPILASGLIAAALVGAGGAAVGAAIENALAEGLPRDEAYVYMDAVRKGRTVVIVLVQAAADVSKVRSALADAGAESVDAARERWGLGLRSADEETYG